jgi:MarR family transcriptional repressor of emrRAB
MVSLRYNLGMNHETLYELIERIGALVRAEERAAAKRFGLQPVHLHALHYLHRCNRYSDTPSAVTEFLGTTKGTVSQTLLLLEAKGLIARRSDPADKRRVRLLVTAPGLRVLQACLPPPALQAGLADAEEAGAADALRGLLRTLQRERGNLAFGVCRTCQHFRENGLGAEHQCGLTGEPLSTEDSGRLCREHAAMP